MKPICKRIVFASITAVGAALFAISLLPIFRGATDMFWIMTVVGAAVAAIGIIGLFYRSKAVVLNSKYARKRALLSEPEIEFLELLRRIAPDRYEVVPQTALAAVIDKTTNAQYRNELFRICDYCFVNKRTFEPLLLVELNDSSHLRADRRARDEKVAAICADARLPLITFWLSDDLSFGTVKKAVTRAILK